MKKKILFLFIISLMLLLTSCYFETGGVNVKLNTPIVELTEDLASWDEIEDALRYEVCLNDEFFYIDLTSYKLHENDQLKEMTEEVKIKKDEHIEQIQKWTKTTFQEVIFDSTCCDWSQVTSTFDRHVIGKEKIAIMIDDIFGNVFGYYFNTKITNCFNGKDCHFKSGTI